MKKASLLLVLLFSCSGGAAEDVIDTVDASRPEDAMADRERAPPDVISIDTEDTIEVEAETAGPESLSLPVEPAAWPPAQALEDPAFLQEFNHTWNENEDGVAELVAFVLPPAGYEDWDRPTLAAPGGLHLRGEDGALGLLPVADEPLVDAVTAAGGVYAATAAAVYRVDEDRTTTLVGQAPEGELIIRLSGDEDYLDVITSGRWGFLSEGEELEWMEWGQGLGAVLRHDGQVFVADGNGLHAFNGFPLPPDPPAWTVDLDVGAPVAVLADRSLPEPLDLVVVGTEGIAGVQQDEGLVEVALLEAPPLPDARAAAPVSDGGFVVAALGGAYRIIDREYGPEYRVYAAERWMPNGDVRDVLASDETDGSLYFATSGGLGWVTETEWSALDKMGPMVERIVERHDRHGAVADSRLTTPGDLSTNIPWDSDNDGGWTCYWVLAECLRYKVTGDPDAKTHFDKSLAYMLSLRTLTGTDWFLARSAIKIEGCQLDDCDGPDDGEWFLSPDEEWWVKADTSNDEVTSHMFAMGMAYDFCADDEQKAAIAAHVDGIIGGIIDHDYLLLDPQDMKCTSHGQFDPFYVNVFPAGMLADGGRRSAQLLGAVNLAHYLTGKQRYLDARSALLEEHGYGENIDSIGDPEIYPFCAGNADCDELAMQAFYPLLRYEPDPVLRERWLAAWGQLYATLHTQEDALWDLTTAYFEGEGVDLSRVMRYLRGYPTDLIRFVMRNEHRQDLAPAPAYYMIKDDEADLHLRSDGHIFPADERPNDRHNTTQFKVQGGHGATREMDSADILFAYWLGRHFGFIAAP